LSALDASFLYLERPSQLLHVASILTFEGTLDFERLVLDLRSRLHLIPRYTDRVMPVPLGLAHPTWEPDPEFDVRDHVRQRTLRPPGNDEQLAELCAMLCTQPLDRTRPLWEVYLIDGYRCDAARSEGSPDSPPAGEHAMPDRSASPERSVLFVKVHHCMIDGVSGVQLLGVLLDASSKPPPIPGPEGIRLRPALPGAATRLVGALSDSVITGVTRGVAALSLLARPRRAARELQQTADAIVSLLRTFLAGVPQTPLNGRISAARGIASVTFSLNETKSIKNRLGGSVNDVVLAVVSGALRRILEERSMNPDRVELRAMVPVNVRPAHEHLRLGNRISMMVAPLPVGILDPVERLRQVRAATEQIKSHNESAKMERIVDLVALLPPSVQRLVGWLQGLAAPINTICTNVPGPPVSLFMQGVRLDHITPIVPLADGIGVAFAILSYADTLTVGITCDATLVPDPREVAAALRTSFEELWAASGLERVTRHRPILPERQRRRSPAARASGPVAEAVAMKPHSVR
jgi:WS/DGAT/MGAT family acyltransferase